MLEKLDDTTERLTAPVDRDVRTQGVPTVATTERRSVIATFDAVCTLQAALAATDESLMFSVTEVSDAVFMTVFRLVNKGRMVEALRILTVALALDSASNTLIWALIVELSTVRFTSVSVDTIAVVLAT